MARIKGIEQAIREMRQLSAKVLRAKKVAELRVAEQMAAQARANAPEDKGLLRAGIDVEQDDVSTTLYSEARYSPYQEFGTGPLTQAPKGLEAYAAEFIVTGEGHTPPQPFFFPAVFQYKDTVITEVEKELAKISK